MGLIQKQRFKGVGVEGLIVIMCIDLTNKQKLKLELNSLVIFYLKFEGHNGAFNLHLLEFAFVYQFYSRKTTLV